MRKVFIDLGANVGAISEAFAVRNPQHEIFCIEPNISLAADIHRKAVDIGRVFNVICAAAWVESGVVEFFHSGPSEASTVMRGKHEINGWPQIDYSKPDRVPCFDFGKWLRSNFTLMDDVTVKMDIEGAEYDLLEHMFRDRSIHLVRKLFCEWHNDRFPDMPNSRHESLVNDLNAVTELCPWT